MKNSNTTNNTNKNIEKEPIFSPQILEIRKNYNFSFLSKDLISGLIVAIIALPLSIALALSSGVGVKEGLFTAIIAGFVVSLLGGTKFQIAGPTAAFATIVANIVAKEGMNTLVISTLFAGVLMICFALLRLGKLIKYMPEVVTLSFTAAIAVSIAIGELKDFFGLDYSQKAIESFDKIRLFATYIGTTNYYALALSVVCLLIIILWKKLPKISTIIPPTLVAVVFSIIATTLINNIYQRDVIHTIGSLYEIPNSLPHLVIPNFSSGINWISIAKNAFSIFFLASLESLLSAVVADKMSSTKHLPNTELIAQGVANIASCLFGGIPATGAIARTASNIKAGAVSPLSGIFASLFLFLILLFFAPYTAYIPMPCIAAILISVAYNMSGWRNIKKLLQSSKSTNEIIANLTLILVVFILTLIFNLIFAIATGCILYAIFAKTKIISKNENKDEVDNSKPN